MSDARARRELLDALWTQDTVFRPDLFDGRVVLVSGGGSGIGLASAVLLARLGARVVICGRRQERLDAATTFVGDKGGQMLGMQTDIREPAQVDALFARIHSQFGRLDGVINNAGGQYPQDAIDYTPKGWKAVIDNNLNGTWFMMQRAAQHWRAHGGPGAIVNVVAVIERGIPGIAHSVAARAGIIGATRTVAVEWAPLGIRVNCIAPGLTASGGLEVYPAQARREFDRANPLRRLATLAEIAQPAVFLASPAAGFMTGEVMTVDGGGRLWGELWTAGRPEAFQCREDAP